jgi:hypothetical protein
MSAELVADCPRCNARKITFDVRSQNRLYNKYDWKWFYEVFCVCRHCEYSTIFIVSSTEPSHREFMREKGPIQIVGAINRMMDVEEYVSLKDAAPIPPPEHLPVDIQAAFNEGAKCAAIGCHNAAGTMFRLAIDLATSDLLPKPDPEIEKKGLNAKIRRDLGLRLPWMFENNLLPEALRDLSTCVKDDGNDGAHRGTLKKEDAEDLLDFSARLLERIFTEPERLRIAKARRDERNAPKK